MIIILGPDASGKSTLVEKLGLHSYHFNKDSKYEHYLKPLCSLDAADAVLDRHIICEYPYSTVMRRQFAFTMKQFHNIVLLTLIQNPLVILNTHKPYQHDYSPNQYLPYDKWDRCLALYRHFLNTHHIRHIEYDYLGPITVGAIEIMHQKHIDEATWWRERWGVGVGCIGSTYPKVLLVAERLGPNNMNNLPFETGPTGRMLTDMIAETGTPLGKLAITNLVKSYRRDTRNPNESDYELLEEELEHLKPEKVVFMGGIAKLGIKTAKKCGIEHHEIAHFGYYSHRGITDVTKMPKYLDEWRKIMGIIP